MRILQFPKDLALLRRVCRPVREEEFGSDALVEFTTRLGAAMLDAGGLGLAANQVEEAPGGEPWALFTLATGPGAFGVVCNPEVVREEGVVLGREGCLSFAGGRVASMVRAPVALELRGRNPRGAEFTILAEMINARAIAHEVAHLRGHLMSDRMSTMKRAVFLRDVARGRVAAATN